MDGNACRKGDTFIKRSNSMIFSRVESRNRSRDKNKNKIKNSKRSPRAYFSDSLGKNDREGSVSPGRLESSMRRTRGWSTDSCVVKCV